jgi:hypothetical protein
MTLMSYQPSSDWMSWDELRSLKENEDRPPLSVRNATRFMYAGAAIDAVNGIVALAAYFNLVSGIVGASTLQLAPSQWHLAEAAGAGYIIATVLLRIGLWLWMATKCSSGRRWARVLSTVFFAIDSLGLVLVSGSPISGREWQLLPPATIWLVGLCAVALLWRGESNEFFSARFRRY